MGGWTGVSMASFDTFLNIAESEKLISEETTREIGDFYLYTQSLINFGNISDSDFIQVQYLAYRINQQLDQVLKKIHIKKETLLQKG